MDIKKITEDIVRYVKETQNLTKEQIEAVVEKRLTEKIVNVLEPEGVYEKGRLYEGHGEYIGIVDTHPHGADYFLRQHHFRVPTVGSNIPSDINTVLIREIRK